MFLTDTKNEKWTGVAQGGMRSVCAVGEIVISIKVDESRRGYTQMIAFQKQKDPGAIKQEEKLIM